MPDAGSEVKVLSVSDKVLAHLYSASVATHYSDVELIIGCGDLPYYYLEYLLSMLNVPLLYVHGNHDPEHEYLADGSAITGPLGGLNLHRRTHYEKGLLLAGLEGSIRYRHGCFQYTQYEMWLNVFSLVPWFFFNKLRYGRYLDMLVAHSPPYGIHNGEDRVHVGFWGFLWLMRTFKPRYLLHGHRHIYNPDETTTTQYYDTTVLNIYPYKVLDIEVPK